MGGCIPYGWLSMSMCMCRLARPVLPFRRGRRRCRAMRRLLARLRRLLVTLSPKPPPRPHPHPHPSPSPSPSPPLLSSPSPPLTLTLTLITHLGHTLAPSPTLSIDPRPHSLMFHPLASGASAAAAVLSTARASRAPRHARSRAAAAAASAEADAGDADLRVEAVHIRTSRGSGARMCVCV